MGLKDDRCWARLEETMESSQGESDLYEQCTANQYRSIITNNVGIEKEY